MSIEAELKTLTALVSAQNEVIKELMTTIATIGISAKAWDKHIASAAIDGLAQRLNDTASNRSQQPDAEFLFYYADTATAVARRYD